MWFEYKDNKLGELYIFYFENQAKKLINRFPVVNNGMYDFKFLNSEDKKSDKYIFYV